MKVNNSLEFTGERFTPECVREIWYEHYHRYAFAQRLIKDKIVLDAACGEGYGSNILAHKAKHVTGIDIDINSITHAKNRYKKENLTFNKESCTKLSCKENFYDVIISFETLEHLGQQQEMLAEFDRVLKPNGLLIISTPDKKHYSDISGFENEFHVKELYKSEFQSLINNHWQAQIWYAQAMNFNSIFEKLNTEKKQYATDVLNTDQIESDRALLTPMYYVVIATKQAKNLPPVPDLHLFSDKQQTVYEHYNKTIKDYIYLANKHNALLKTHEKWLSIPILGKILKLLNRD